MQPDEQNVKHGINYLMFAMEIDTLQKDLGIWLVEKTLRACS